MLNKKWTRGASGNRWVATNIHLDQCSPLGINGLHCIRFPHQVRKLLLDLALGEPLALVLELTCFDNSIKLDLFMSSYLDLCVHNMITRFLLHAVKVEIYWCQLLYDL